MGRQGNHDPTTTVNSSIALLQERFRQLEKVKERREGKQLLKLLSSESTSSVMHNPTSPHNSQQPRLVNPHNDALSLGLNFTNKHGADHNTMKPTPSFNMWPQGASASRNFDTPDVDTSLHL